MGDSNIVIKYLGWINQDRTDFYKAKSRAIPAVKSALEEAGFAIPEPIYRLRIDPRSAPLPSVAEPAEKPQIAPTSSAQKVQQPAAAPADVAPADEVAKMVEEERATPTPKEADLLDSSRPVE